MIRRRPGKVSPKEASAKRKGGGAPKKKRGMVTRAVHRRRPALRAEQSAAPAIPAPAENPVAKGLAHKVATLVLDRKASDVVILDVRGIASYADYVVIASGESDRQVSAMAEHVQMKLKDDDGMAPLGSEGTEMGQWVLLDFGDVVTHLFCNEVRAHYDLEGLWADAPREMVS
jgi:ribosome-associated protein